MSAELVARFVKRFGTGPAIGADLRRPTDEFSITLLFGPSGCGKTTTLRCLAGLECPDEGRIAFEEAVWFDAGGRVFLSPQQRDIGCLFQEYALFPHLTVARNIAYGLRSGSRSEQRRLVSEVLDLLRLTGLDNRYPHQVSGGEQQRIALARVLVRRPRLLLLDEPLSALDAPTREQLRPELRRWLADFGIPVVLVSHDWVEASALADHLIVMDLGKVRQQGPADEVFRRPADVETARIVGMGNVLPGQVMRMEEGRATVAIGTGQLVANVAVPSMKHVDVCIRAESIVLRRPASDRGGPRNCLDGVIKSLTPEGPVVRVALDCGFPLVALVTRSACEELHLREGEAITAAFEAACVHLIARSY
jgi:molybdate transport system ATP-binding protein